MMPVDAHTKRKISSSQGYGVAVPHRKKPAGGEEGIRTLDTVTRILP